MTDINTSPFARQQGTFNRDNINRGSNNFDGMAHQKRGREDEDECAMQGNTNHINIYSLIPHALSFILIT